MDSAEQFALDNYNLPEFRFRAALQESGQSALWQDTAFYYWEQVQFDLAEYEREFGQQLI